MLIEGLYVPLPIPFTRDDAVYLSRLKLNVHRYSLTPAAGLVALPPGGEAAMLSDTEVAEVLAAVRVAAANEKVLVAGIERDSVAGALAVARLAAAERFDAVLLAAPRGWQALSAPERAVYFSAVADGSPLPVLLHSSGGNGGYALRAEELGELAAHANVIGVVDDSLSVERMESIAAATSAKQRDVTVTSVFAAVTGRMKAAAGQDGSFVPAGNLTAGSAAVLAPVGPALKTRTRRVGFQVIASGAAAGLTALLEGGLSAVMPRAAACCPQCVHEIYAAFKDGDAALSAERAARFTEADELLVDLGPAAIKYVCDRNAYFGGPVRLPRLALTIAQKSAIDTAFASLRH